MNMKEQLERSVDEIDDSHKEEDDGEGDISDAGGSDDGENGYGR